MHTYVRIILLILENSPSFFTILLLKIHQSFYQWKNYFRLILMSKFFFFQSKQLGFASTDYIESGNKAIANSCTHFSELLFNYQQFSSFGLGDQTSIRELKYTHKKGLSNIKYFLSCTNQFLFLLLLFLIEIVSAILFSFNTTK